MPKNERYIVGLDIGTTKISCVIAELRDNGSVDVVGLGVAMVGYFVGEWVARAIS